MNNQAQHLSQTLHEARVALNGTLVQLDYLQSLLEKIWTTDKQAQSIQQQIHRIKVNNAGVRDSLALIPSVGHTK